MYSSYTSFSGDRSLLRSCFAPRSSRLSIICSSLPFTLAMWVVVSSVLSYMCFS